MPLVALLGLAAGCTYFPHSMRKSETAATTGCAPDSIEFRNVDGFSWEAACNGKLFFCARSGTRGSTSCTPAATETVAEAQPTLPAPTAEAATAEAATVEVSNEFVEALTGTWTDPNTTCADNPHRISFAPDRRTFTLVYDHESPQGRFQLGVYDVKGATATTVRGALRNEDRVDDSGALVEWTIEVVSEREYCWRRSDWPSHACTPPRVRCGEEQ